MRPHDLTSPALVVAIGVAFVICRAPLVPPGGLAMALGGTAALSAAIVLLVALVARLAAVPAGDGVLAACALAAAGLAVVVRARGAALGAPAEVAFDLALATAAAAGGRLFANQVQEAWWIVPLGLTGGAADMFSVFVPGAPTHEWVRTDAPVLNYLLVVWPAFRGGPAHGFCGVTDLAICAILYALSLKAGFDVRRTFALLAGALIASLVLAGLAGIGLPAIPFLFGGYVAGHARDLLASWRARVT